MSLFGTMKTAVSGMNAQSNKLGVVGDNIANADTTGYKRASVQFSSLILPSTAGNYNSGVVNSNLRYSISDQGALKYTSSGSDLAIQGTGFFLVQDSNNTTYMTRAGSFSVDDSGNMINPAGLALMGHSFSGGTPATTLINGFSGLEKINLANGVPRAAATTTGTFISNVDARKPVIAAANLPSANNASAQYSHKSSVVGYDSLGREIQYDVYYSKSKAEVAAVAGPPAVAAVPAEWQVTVFRKDQASASSGFPYASAPLNNSITVQFDPATGAVTPTSSKILSFTDDKTIPSQTISFNLGGMSQLATDFSTSKATLDGSKASTVKSVSIDNDGTVYAIYSDGTREPRYRIALANVVSPDNLQLEDGNVYSQSSDSGVVSTGFPGEGLFGITVAGALEDSNVDMANELTDMIQAQRSYTANSKVFQTGSELMDVLLNLKR